MAKTVSRRNERNRSRSEAVPIWFQLYEKEVQKSGLSRDGHQVYLVRGRRGKIYGSDVYYGVTYSRWIEGVGWVDVYVMQTPDKAEARRCYQQCLEDRLPRFKIIRVK